MKKLLILFLVLSSFIQSEAQIVVNSYKFGSAVNLLADSLANTPLFIISTRNTKKSYTGPQFKIRAGTTNAEATTTPDPATGWFSLSGTATVTAAGTSGFSVGATMSVTSFVGSQDGFVVSVYNHLDGSVIAYQNTNANQPRIITAGALETMGGKPVIRFVSASSHYLNVNNIGSATNYSASIVFRSVIVPPASANGPVLGNWGNDTNGNHWTWTDSNLYDDFTRIGRNTIGAISPKIDLPTAMTIESTPGSPGTYTLRTQGVQRYLQNSSGTTALYSGTHRIGSTANGGGYYWDGYLGELIIWKSTITSDLTLLWNNQKLKWGL